MQSGRRRVVAASLSVVAAAAGALAVTAGGQTAAPPAGTLEFDVVQLNSARGVGANTGSGRPLGGRRGRQHYPHLADVLAYNGEVRVAGRPVGRVDGWQVLTDRGDGHFGGDASFADRMLVTIGADSILLGTSRYGNDVSAQEQAPIEGGTGRYAGAKGVATDRLTSSSPDRQIEHYTLTFTA
jgi:hypothetical protein